MNFSKMLELLHFWSILIAIKKNAICFIVIWKIFSSVKENFCNHEVFVFFVRCNADVGRRGDRQIISLGDGCRHKSVVIHEIGHVIGFWHEQNRPDRDGYVNIYTDNIMDRKCEVFSSMKETVGS